MAVHNALDRAAQFLGDCMLGADGQRLVHQIDNRLCDMLDFADLAFDFRGAVRAIQPFERINQFHTYLRF